MLAKFIDRPREDSLTAAVFSHLLHLPSEVFWDIMHDASSSSSLRKYSGEPRCIHAWPNWSAEGTRNSDRVIPDLVIEFDAFDLIVEAKRWDHPMQDTSQWKAELKAYINEYGAKKRPVIMIALGGIHSHKDEVLKDVWQSNEAQGEASYTFVCQVYMCQWSSLLLACQRQKRKLEQMTERCSRTLADLRIMNDLTDLFIRHSFMPLHWFADYDFKTNLLSPSAETYRPAFRTN
jgi:hypothetical protein